MGYIVSLNISGLVKPNHIMKLKGKLELIPILGPAFVYPPLHNDSLADALCANVCTKELLPQGAERALQHRRWGRATRPTPLAFDSFLEIINLPMSNQKDKMNLANLMMSFDRHFTSTLESCQNHGSEQ